MKNNIINTLSGDEYEALLSHECKLSAQSLHLPGSDFIERVFMPSDRNIGTLVNLRRLFAHGHLANTGYLSILPVDQGVEHSAGASFAPNPMYFDPENIFRLALEAGCNGVASSLGVLSAVARKYSHRIPLILKLNHNELLSYPNRYDQKVLATVKQAKDMGCAGVGATVYFGSIESGRQMREVSELFSMAHDEGMFTILWCYLRNESFGQYTTAADLTGQANHLGATIGADIIKQKQPERNGGYEELNFGVYDKRMYSELCTEHPIDMTRYQVLNCYSGRAGLINSGGGSGKTDLADAVRTAIINKRAGGMGLICGRKAFQKPLKEGVELLRMVQEVYLDPEITVAK
ncbi:fructose-bisphosphate aldolase (plasmid) [Fulvitalea axinellae]|uniref:fructose-bisphosphate aldolase n=1 Tax=Fulvitalea axinellae TaxID=1182444 RepID=A0AAU9D0I5_9BACT|nr:fructose-bisphosphate aldolase [Fulvitalea axinellae]